jgi:transcriptional regulator with XRE-family HTH domain
VKEFRPARKRVEVSVGESGGTLRELQGLRQNQLAELSGVPRATLSAIVEPAGRRTMAGLPFIDEVIQ